MSDPRLADGPTRRLLEGPIAATLLRLAAPGVIMLVAQVAINVLEAYFVGRLGPDALAGISVTFPLVMLMPALIFGLAGLPRLGITGAGLAVVAYYALGSLVFLGYLRGGRSLVRLAPVRLRGELLGEILSVGAPSLVNNVLTNLTVVVLTALVGPFGTLALAGYGLGVRLEYLQIPLVFGFGSALVTMVGTNFGAGQRTRARRVAWTGALIAAGTTEAIGLAAALFPHAWLGLFSHEPEVLAAGAAYLRVVGPAYGFFGLGLALYFASQGAGRRLWPLLAGSLRRLSAAAGGWLILHQLPGELTALFAVMALALVLFGSTLAGPIRLGAWEAGRR